MCVCIMIVTNPKLHHDWGEDWAGTHMRKVGNNWRITLRMCYEKKARGEVLEHMVLQGIANLIPPIPLPSTNYFILVFLDGNHKGIVCIAQK